MVLLGTRRPCSNAGYFQVCELRSSQGSAVSSFSSATSSISEAPRTTSNQAATSASSSASSVPGRLAPQSGVDCLPTGDERIRQLIASW